MSAFSRNPLGVFRIEGMSLDYSDFVPRLCNFCHSAGLARRKLSLGTAFCADQDQGRAALLLTKHFGAYPIEIGNEDATLDFRDADKWMGRSNDIVLLQAGHVLNISTTTLHAGSSGSRTEPGGPATGCGTLSRVLAWYLREYQDALSHVRFHLEHGRRLVEIDTVLLERNGRDGLCLSLDRLVEKAPSGSFQTNFESDLKVTFLANIALPAKLFEGQNTRACKVLDPEWFSFNTSESKVEMALKCAEVNLRDQMPYIVSAQDPLFTAAEINIQKEFDANTQRIRVSSAAKGKRLVYLAGINVEAPYRGGKFLSETEFLPWQVYIQDDEGKCEVLNQVTLMRRLREASPVNPDTINLDKVLQQGEPDDQ
ncbi:MAG: hypothetical protein OEU91_06225 [Gammaproteobacteria bacterium]|nr:hypothetical protein [Gammaproteobacteria bacterium]